MLLLKCYSRLLETAVYYVITQVLLMYASKMLGLFRFSHSDKWVSMRSER